MASVWFMNITMCTSSIHPFLYSDAMYRIKPEELYILSSENGRGRSFFTAKRDLTDLKHIRT